jgi:hypothetical protein
MGLCSFSLTHFPISVFLQRRVLDEHTRRVRFQSDFPRRAAKHVLVSRQASLEKTTRTSLPALEAMAFVGGTIHRALSSPLVAQPFLAVRCASSLCSGVPSGRHLVFFRLFWKGPLATSSSLPAKEIGCLPPLSFVLGGTAVGDVLHTTKQATIRG